MGHFRYEVKVQPVKFHYLFTENGPNFRVGAHKSVESAYSLYITSDIYILFLICVLFSSLLYHLTIDAALSQFLLGDHISVPIFTGKTGKNDEQAH